MLLLNSRFTLEDKFEQYWRVNHCFSNKEIVSALKDVILTRCTRLTSYPAVVHGWVDWMGSIHVRTIGAGIHLAPSMLIKTSKSRRSTFLKTLLG